METDLSNNFPFGSCFNINYKIKFIVFPNWKLIKPSLIDNQHEG